MTETLVKLYERYRAKYPGVRASDALRWAKYRIEQDANPPFELTESGNGFRAEIERDGYKVTIRAEYDYDAEPNVTFSSDWNPDAIEHPEWRAFMDRTDGRGDDSNYGYRTPDVYRWITPEWTSLADIRESLSAAGYARNVADTMARENIEREVHNALREDRAVFAFIVKAYREGIELGFDAIGGYEIDADASYADMLADLVSGIEENGLIEQAIAEADKNLDALVAGRG